jgi:uncharacterized protein YciI
MIEKRSTVMDAHRKYMSESPIKLLMSGPLVDDDGEAVVGSLYVVEAKSRVEVEAFQKDDPLMAADLWKTVEVHAFLKRIDNRE